MRILIVEDQQKMSSYLKKGLVAQGFSVDVTVSGTMCERLVAEYPYDLILLDINIEDQDGYTTARNLRKSGYKNPILMLTALGETKNKVEGLDSGADDYLSKPFEFDELNARIRALLRRNHQVENSKLCYGDIEMDLNRRAVTRNKENIQLTSKEFSLLEYFLRNPERALTRVQISEHVWDINFDANSNVIDVHINGLRKKLENQKYPRIIHTMIGYGYMLKHEA